jgi:hypothetical protein
MTFVEEQRIMFEAIKTMNDAELREMITAIAGSADPWSTDILAIGIDAIDAIGDELFRRTLRSGHTTSAD